MTGLSSIVMNPYLLLLLSCHLLSDYYFQSQKMADRKDQDRKVLGLHILYVALPLIVVSFCHLDLWWICLIILLTHAVIDYGKPWVQKQLHLTAAWTFVLDQVLHVGIISFLVLWGAKNGTTYLPTDILKLIFYVLIVGKPTNIVFKILFAKYQLNSVFYLPSLLLGCAYKKTTNRRKSRQEGLASLSFCLSFWYNGPSMNLERFVGVKQSSWLF